MIWVERIIAGIIAFVFGVSTIIAEQKVERTRSVKDTTAMILSIGAYCASMIAMLE